MSEGLEIVILISVCCYRSGTFLVLLNITRPEKIPLCIPIVHKLIYFKKKSHLLLYALK